MIGNDIVDLAFATKESNWKRPRYLDKIFTLEEQKIIDGSFQKGQMVWLLWSMKESAYKLYVQHNQKRFFAPKKFACSLLKANKKEAFGEVTIDRFKCFTQTELHDEYIYTVSRSDPFQNYRSQTFEMYHADVNTQSKSLYQMVLSRVAEFSGEKDHLFSIKKNPVGVPFLFNINEQKILPISLTHHGRFGAFAIKY